MSPLVTESSGVNADRIAQGEPEEAGFDPSEGTASPEATEAAREFARLLAGGTEDRARRLGIAIFKESLEDLEARLDRLPLGEGNFSIEPESFYLSAGYGFGHLSGINPLDFESEFPLAATICQNVEAGIRFSSIFRGLQLAIDSELAIAYQSGQSQEEIDQDLLPFGEDNEFLQELLQFSIERASRYHMGGAIYRWYASPVFRNDNLTLIRPSFELALFLGAIETIDRAAEETEEIREWLFAPSGAVGAKWFEIDEGPVQLFLHGRIRMLVGSVNGILFENSLGIAIDPGEL